MTYDDWTYETVAAPVDRGDKLFAPTTSEQRLAQPRHRHGDDVVGHRAPFPDLLHEVRFGQQMARLTDQRDEQAQRGRLDFDGLARTPQLESLRIELELIESEDHELDCAQVICVRPALSRAAVADAKQLVAKPKGSSPRADIRCTDEVDFPRRNEAMR